METHETYLGYEQEASRQVIKEFYETRCADLSEESKNKMLRTFTYESLKKNSDGSLTDEEWRIC